LRGYLSRINWRAVLALIGGLLVISAAAPVRIALAGYCPPIQGSSLPTIVYGGLTVNAAAGPVGSVVEARSPRGDLVGCFVVENAGDYGAMYVYGEDTSVSPTIPGMRSGEPIAFSVDGVSATSTPAQTWANDWKTVSHQVALAATLTAPPPAASNVQATVSENGLTLTWSPGNAYANHYEVWRGTTPYYDPGAPGCNCTLLGTTTGLSWPDSDAAGVDLIGDVSTNYFYAVRAVNAAGASAVGPRVGEFDFALQPGSS